MKYITYFFLSILLLSFTSIHKYYVSVTKATYVKEKQSLQFISRIFIDDLEAVLQQRYDEDITIEAKVTNVDYYIERYLKEKLTIDINNIPQDFKFIGKTTDLDIVKCFIEIENVQDISSIKITNQILFDLFPEQQNIVRTNINSQNKTFVFTKQQDSGLLNFN